jgi:hypothetical protein
MTRLVLCIAIAALVFSGSASAQDGLRSASLPERTMTNPVPAPRTDLYGAPPGVYAPHFDQLTPGLPPNVVFPGTYLPWGPFPEGIDYARAAAQVYGYLQLQLQPFSAQVYVDGLYVGTVGDLRGGRRLPIGPHRLEIRAPGYQSISIDFRIDPGQTTFYRTDLTVAAATPVAAPAVAANPKTFYVIPGCYAGDRQPDAQRLPPGCQASNVFTLPPVLNRVASRR